MDFMEESDANKSIKQWKTPVEAHGPGPEQVTLNWDQKA